MGQVLDRLGWRSGQRTLVIVGGAGGMPSEERDQLEGFFERFLVPLIEMEHIFVIDGGTNVGVMEAIGMARTRARAHFPLIGVLVEELAGRYPGILQKDHSHFVLTPGSDWGDEIPWMSELTSILAKDTASLTLLFNGGEIAWQDASASVAANRPILVAEGSGRTADMISQAYQGSFSDPRTDKLLSSQLVTVVNPFLRPDEFIAKTRHLLNLQGE